MKTLGLDIGTTTISSVVWDDQDGVISCHTVENDSFLPGHSWECLQDPAVIHAKATDSIHHLLQEHPDISAIGLCGQMHGILYLDAVGMPVSPLYTWQDGRGDLPYDERHSWREYLSEITGYELSTGFGMVTHFYNLSCGLVPKEAAVLCTIQDYLAMKLSGKSTPVIDSTNAASLGLYDCRNHCFCPDALQKAGIDSAILPEPVSDPCLGTGSLGIPVYAALGDNQASFLGATDGRTDVLLVNMGTGGQISIYTPDYLQAPSLETRPFPDGGWLLVGASLCGGKSYALLEQFFRETVKMVTGQDICTYEAMATAMDRTASITDPLNVVTLFQGTRKDPSRRGTIDSISTGNFTPLHLIHGVMQGMADELYMLFEGYLAMGGTPLSAMIGSGNGLQKNPHLCRIFKNTFGLPFILSKNKEEAACGAAIYAAKHCQ